MAQKPGDFLPARGRAGGLSYTLELVRPLTAADLFELQVPGAGAERHDPPGIQRITANHHAAARLVAEGLSAVDVALRVGRTAQRIRDLQNDPSFRDLVAYYADQRSEVELEDGARIRAKLVDVAEQAVDEIRDRIEDPGKRAQIPMSELRQVAQLGLDRTVAPPKTAAPAATPPTQITFNIAGRGLTVPSAPSIPSSASVPSTTIEHEAQDAPPITEGDK